MAANPGGSGDASNSGGGGGFFTFRAGNDTNPFANKFTAQPQPSQQPSFTFAQPNQGNSPFVFGQSNPSSAQSTNQGGQNSAPLIFGQNNQSAQDAFRQSSQSPPPFKFGQTSQTTITSTSDQPKPFLNPAPPSQRPLFSQTQQPSHLNQSLPSPFSQKPLMPQSQASSNDPGKSLFARTTAQEEQMDISPPQNKQNPFSNSPRNPFATDSSPAVNGINPFQSSNSSPNLSKSLFERVAPQEPSAASKTTQDTMNATSRNIFNDGLGSTSGQENGQLDRSGKELFGNFPPRDDSSKALESKSGRPSTTEETTNSAPVAPTQLSARSSDHVTSSEIPTEIASASHDIFQQTQSTQQSVGADDTAAVLREPNTAEKAFNEELPPHASSQTNSQLSDLTPLQKDEYESYKEFSSFNQGFVSAFVELLKQDDTRDLSEICQAYVHQRKALSILTPQDMLVAKFPSQSEDGQNHPTDVELVATGNGPFRETSPVAFSADQQSTHSGDVDDPNHSVNDEQQYSSRGGLFSSAAATSTPAGKRKLADEPSIRPSKRLETSALARSGNESDGGADETEAHPSGEVSTEVVDSQHHTKRKRDDSPLDSSKKSRTTLETTPTQTSPSKPLSQTAGLFQRVARGESLASPNHSTGSEPPALDNIEGQTIAGTPPRTPSPSKQQPPNFGKSLFDRVTSADKAAEISSSFDDDSTASAKESESSTTPVQTPVHHNIFGFAQQLSGSQMDSKSEPAKQKQSLFGVSGQPTHTPAGRLFGAPKSAEENLATQNQFSTGSSSASLFPALSQTSQTFLKPSSTSGSLPNGHVVNGENQGVPVNSTSSGPAASSTNGRKIATPKRRAANSNLSEGHPNPFNNAESDRNPFAYLSDKKQSTTTESADDESGSEDSDSDRDEDESGRSPSEAIKDKSQATHDESKQISLFGSSRNENGLLPSARNSIPGATSIFSASQSSATSGTPIFGNSQVQGAAARDNSSSGPSSASPGLFRTPKTGTGLFPSTAGTTATSTSLSESHSKPSLFGNLQSPSTLKASTSTPSLSFFGPTPGAKMPNQAPNLASQVSTPSKGNDSETGDDNSVNGDAGEEIKPLEQIDLTNRTQEEQRDEDLLFESKARCWIFSKESKEWEGRGIAVLRLQKNKESGVVSAQLRGDPTGKLLANSRLISTADYKHIGKRQVMMPLVGEKGDLTQWNVRLKEDSEAVELANKLQECKST